MVNAFDFFKKKMSLQTASTLLALATEKSRHLADIIGGAESDVDRTRAELERLYASFSERESSAAADIALADQSLVLATGGFSADMTGADAAARALSSVSNSIDRLGGFRNDIEDGARAIAGAAKMEVFADLGNSLASALESISGTAENARKTFGATVSLPAMKSAVPIESTAANPDTLARGASVSLPSAGGAHAHLLILTAPDGESYYFNLNTAGYDELKRATSYSIAAQTRLTRRNALQAVSKGSEVLTLAGVVYTKKSGGGQLERLRAIGFRMEPLTLTTGYGETLGIWYLTRIDEDQAYLFMDGMPRKQTFTLEFERYGEDYQNV
jgi:phage protein U